MGRLVRCHPLPTAEGAVENENLPRKPDNDGCQEEAEGKDTGAETGEELNDDQAGLPNTSMALLSPSTHHQ